MEVTSLTHQLTMDPANKYCEVRYHLWNCPKALDALTHTCSSSSSTAQVQVHLFWQVENYQS